MRLLFALFLLPFALPAMAEDTRYNVLLIFGDDQRADTIAALGNAAIQTPNLDQLVKRGLSFNRAYMQGAMNGATCVPSRAMLLSGRSLFQIDEKLKRDKTWPAAFGEQGYTTFISGKWHNGADSIAASFQQGRSLFVGGMTNPLQAKLNHFKDGKLEPPTVQVRHTCAIFADEAIAFLQAPQGKPFFCYVPFNAPHDPHTVPDEFNIRYDPAKLPLPRNFLPQHPFNNGEMNVRDEQLLPWPRPPQKMRDMLAEYYRYVSYLDAQVGRILDALEKSPFAKNTIIIYTADSGVARGSHGLIGKQNVYEHSVRVPLIIAGPDIPADKRTEAMCYLFDLVPTIGKRCGITPPASNLGMDLSRVLEDPATPGRERLLFAYRDVQRAIRNERWKLIRYPQVNVTQLFDLINDPDEVHNLAETPGQQERVKEMLARLKEEQTRFGDVVPLTVAKLKPAEWVPPVKK